MHQDFEDEDEEYRVYVGVIRLLWLLGVIEIANSDGTINKMLDDIVRRLIAGK